MRSFAAVMLVAVAGMFLISGNCIAGEAGAVLTLSEGVKLAAEGNRDIRIAGKDIDITSADVRIAKAKFFPEVNASLSQNFLAYQPGAAFGSQIVRTAERSFVAYDLIAQQLLYTFGATSALVEASKTVLDISKMNLQRTRNLVALTFVVAYFDLLESEKMQLVARREIESLSAQRTLAQDLYDAGTITRNDLLQAEVRLSDARQRLLIADNLIDLNTSRLNNLLARPLRSEVRAADPPVKLPAATTLEASWETAKKERIELAVMDKQIRVTELEEKARRSEYFPTLFAQGGYSYTENRYQLHEDNWALTLGARINLFNGGATKASLAKVRHQREQLQEERNKLTDDILLEVERNFLDMENARMRIEVTKDAIAQAEENLRITRVKYQEGVGTSTDVLDAITLLTTAQNNYYRALYEFRRAHAGLLYAMGLDLVSHYGGTQ